MPALDWKNFNALAGSRSQNFENLCRGLIRLHFESYGEFRALRNQPGVEFHLNLSQECPTLGQPPRWYGWQCKLHEQTATGHLQAASKTKIKESLRITEKHLPELTDWVLWTPYTLHKKDQDWLTSLNTELELHLWSEEEIDTYLGGPGIILRSTYFGDLIASPEELKRQHQRSVQPIRERWFEPVHQITEAERTLRRMLGEPGSWNHLIDIGKRLQDAAEAIRDFSGAGDHVPKELVSQFIDSCDVFADMLLQFHKVLADGDLETIQQQFADRQALIDNEVKATPRHLRKLAVPIALDATNALFYMRKAQALLDEVEDFLGVGLVAVLADAGGGKTQLAAHLTSEQETRPAGVLLHGRNLHRGQDINHLAQTYTLNGMPLAGFESLLAALDAAAKRARCRLPLMIDGLNEAENPKDWKPILASLGETAKAYPNVLIVCTLRTGEHSREETMWRPSPQTTDRESFAVMALPDAIRRIESEGFGLDTEEAVEKYFHHFKIATGDAEIPLEFLQHPLTLRIFCQVTNPVHEVTVNVDYFPASLPPLFEKYVENSAIRIADLSNLTHSYTSDEVNEAVYKFGMMLWDEKSREVPEKEFRDEVADSGRPWESSIVNLLSQEGLIFRDPGRAPHEFVITPAYDALGGFLIASYLLAIHGDDSSFGWLNEPSAIASFGGDHSHELASDIFKALVALTPRKMARNQLWKVAPDIYRDAALRFATLLDAEFLDDETIEALYQFFAEVPKERKWLYSRLNATRTTVNHPLNAEFLDRSIRPMTPVSERDLSWTEWIRETRGERFADILTLEKQWKSSLTDRPDSDRLRLKWLMWHLTSTDRELRDIATRALYWFGRGDPSALFDEAISSLGINDPYVPERMFAASYGVAMALYGDFDDASFSSEIFPRFVRNLFDALFADGAPHRTTHILFREYAFRMLELAAFHDPSLFSANELAKTKPPFSVDGLPPWGEESDNRKGRKIKSAPSPFRMDFENYTIGRLVSGRRNYDYQHAGYKKTRARILWRIKQLGWSGENFEEIDHRIAHSHGWRRSSNNPRKTDRYGKKYSWIAYFEMSGFLHDQGIIDQTCDYGRTSDADIDPSFPERILKTRIIDRDILGDPEITTTEWITSGEQPNLKPYLQIPRIERYNGPWVTLDGFVVQEDETRGRRSFCFVRSFIVKNKIADKFFGHLSNQNLGGRWLPDKPSVIYTFAGEIPWCATYPVNGQTKFSFVDGEQTVTTKRTRKEFYLGGRNIDISEFDLLMRKSFGMSMASDDENKLSDSDIEKIEVREIPYKAVEVQQKFLEFEVLIPVCDFGWEDYHTVASNAGHAVTLAREIANDLGLVNRAQEFDLFANNGTRASLSISDLDSDFNNYQSFFLIRENLLQSYLQKNQSTLIWAIWGEREYSSKQTDILFQNPSHPCRTHGDIHKIWRYKW